MKNPIEIREAIIERVNVTKQKVTLVKAFVIEDQLGDSQKILQRVLDNFNSSSPENVVIHNSIDIDPQINRVAEVISWQMAFSEAIWSLIGYGIIQPVREGFFQIHPYQSWTTVVPGSGGQSSGWNFPEFNSGVPPTVRLAPSLVDETPQLLSDPDLLLNDLSIPKLHKSMEEGIRLSIACFRHELFLPSAAMLGFVSEGAWIETEA